MDFFNDIGKKLSDAAKVVEEKSGELLEAGKLNMEIFKEEDAIRGSYRKIGEVIYKAFSKGESYEGRADELCADIRERNKKIEQLRAKLSEAGKAKESSEKQQSEKDSSEEKQSEQDFSEAKQSEKNSPEGKQGENSGEPEVSYYEAVKKMNEMRNSDSSSNSTLQ